MQDINIYDIISILIYQKTGIFVVLKPQYLSFILGFFLVYKFRITGLLLLLHAFILWNYDIQFEYEQKYTSELTRSVSGAFYSEHLWDVVMYSIIAIPILLIIGIILDIRRPYKVPSNSNPSKKI